MSGITYVDQVKIISCVDLAGICYAKYSIIWSKKLKSVFHYNVRHHCGSGQGCFPIGFETQALTIFAQVILFFWKIAQGAFPKEDRSGENGATGVAASWYLCYSAKKPWKKTPNPLAKIIPGQNSAKAAALEVGPVQS